MSIYSEEIRRLGHLGTSHEKILSLVPRGSVVLDVGCAGGYLARALRERGVEAVDGIEPSLEDAEAARPHCRRLVHGSVEDDEAVAELPDNEYDVIVCGDVLEHLVEPERALRRLIPKLKPGGRFVISVPNVAHYSVRWTLLRGRFEYQDLGLLDRTHLRFFTGKTLVEMLESAGLTVDVRDATYRATRLEGMLVAFGPLAKLHARFVELLMRRLPGLFAYQYVLATRKP